MNNVANLEKVALNFESNKIIRTVVAIISIPVRILFVESAVNLDLLNNAKINWTNKKKQEIK